MRFPRKSLWAVLAVSLWWEVDSCSRDNPHIGVCLHIFLERDFPATEVNHGHRRPGGHVIHENGPQLLIHCESIKELLTCFEPILKDCRNLDHYVDYRELQNSLTKTYEWLCNSTSLGNRLGVLLQSKACIEGQRLRSRQCQNENLPQNIWQKTIRLETDRTICQDLKWQHSCLLQTRELEQCGKSAVDVYNSTMYIFTDNWCNGLASTKSFSVIFSGLIVLILRFVVL